MPPDMGRRVITRVGRKRGEKDIRLIGGMGFAMEELLFGNRRLFHQPQPDDYHPMSRSSCRKTSEKHTENGSSVPTGKYPDFS